MIPHPVYPSEASRADDGQTLLSLGVIRPYKGIADAIEVTRRIPDARLLVAGDPAMPLDDLRTAERVEWRLGYLPLGLDRALSQVHGRCLSVPRRARPVGSAPASARRRRPFGRLRRRGPRRTDPALRRGRVVPAGDVDALEESVRTLLGDADALAGARAGADAARRELTWDASAAQHLDLYHELA